MRPLPRLLPVLLAGLAACSGGVIEDGGGTGDPSGLDHVFTRLSVDGGTPFDFWARFLTGYHYAMRENDCTILAVWPRKRGRSGGWYRFTNLSKQAVWLREGDDKRCVVVKPRETTSWARHSEDGSAMCRGTPAEFHIYARQCLTERWRDTSLASGAFAFLHGERVELTYSGGTSLKFALETAATQPQSR